MKDEALRSTEVLAFRVNEQSLQKLMTKAQPNESKSDLLRRIVQEFVDNPKDE